MSIRINRLDHLVLTVADVERTCRFYQDLLGMEVVTFGAGRKALRFGTQKINLHQAGRELEPKSERPRLAVATCASSPTSPSSRCR